jgi:hypothetical protein
MEDKTMATSSSYWVGTALLLSATAVAMPEVPAAYVADVRGAATAELRGPAEFGRARGSHEGPFVITLGARDDGAVVLTRWDGGRPWAGEYQITPEPSADGIQALVVTGPAARPTGVFRAHRGTVSIISSSLRHMAGRFEMDATGYLAAEPDREDRELRVRGSFTASPSR